MGDSTKADRELRDESFRDGWREGVEDAKEAVSLTRTNADGHFMTAEQKCQALLDGDPAGGVPVARAVLGTALADSTPLPDGTHAVKVAVGPPVTAEWMRGYEAAGRSMLTSMIASEPNAFLRAELARLQAIAFVAAAVSDEFGDDITERDAPVAFARLKALREALNVAPGVTLSRSGRQNRKVVDENAALLHADMERARRAVNQWCDGQGVAAQVEGFEQPHDDFVRLFASEYDAVRRETRESIARYLDHCASVEIGAVSLDGLFDTKQMMSVCASWVRNRLDVKWAAEMAANTPAKKAEADRG